MDEADCKGSFFLDIEVNLSISSLELLPRLNKNL